MIIRNLLKWTLLTTNPLTEVVLHAGENVSDYQDGYTHIDIKEKVRSGDKPLLFCSEQDTQ